jgi:hypothetical protein
MALVWVTWFSVIASMASLLMMTFGPLHGRQWIYLFVLVNGGLSATLITTVHWMVSLVLRQTTDLGRRTARVVVTFFSTVAILSAVVAAIALPSGQIEPVFNYFFSGIVVSATAVSLLVAIQPNRLRTN